MFLLCLTQTDAFRRSTCSTGLSEFAIHMSNVQKRSKTTATASNELVQGEPSLAEKGTMSNNVKASTFLLKYGPGADERWSEVEDSNHVTLHRYFNQQRLLNLLEGNEIGLEEKLLRIIKGEMEGISTSPVQHLSLTSGNLLKEWNFDMFS